MKLQEKLKEYAKRFGEGFPMIPLGWTRTDEEIIELIDRCLEKGKNAYQLGMLKELGEGEAY